MTSPKFSRLRNESKTNCGYFLDDDRSKRNSRNDDDQSLFPFRNSPVSSSSSWLCCKFWRKSSNSERSRSSSIAEGNSTSSNSINDGGEQCRKYSQTNRFLDDLVKRLTTPKVDQFLTDSAEDRIKRLMDFITRSLKELEHQPDVPAFGDEECLTCTTNRASIQTFPCGHKVLCKACFFTIAQVSLQDHQFVLRCVLCRSRVIRWKLQSAAYPIVVRKQSEPPGSFFNSQTSLSPLPPSGTRHPGYM